MQQEWLNIFHKIQSKIIHVPLLHNVQSKKNEQAGAELCQAQHSLG